MNSLKRVARKSMKVTLSSVSKERIVFESENVTVQILKSEWWRKAKNISIYLSTDTGEIQTDRIIQYALQEGKKVFAPFCPIDEKDMKMFRLDSMDSDSLIKNRWGIREFNPLLITTLEESKNLDIIFVPGLAFDSTGNRLGHGRGYYDRFIEASQVNARSLNIEKPLTVALALQQQVLPKGMLVPVDDHDKKPDIILSSNSS